MTGKEMYEAWSSHYEQHSEKDSRVTPEGVCVHSYYVPTRWDQLASASRVAWMGVAREVNAQTQKIRSEVARAVTKAMEGGDDA